MASHKGFKPDGRVRLITGGLGSGKSLLLKWFAATLAEWRVDNGDRYVLFVRLQSLNFLLPAAGD